MEGDDTSVKDKMQEVRDTRDRLRADLELRQREQACQGTPLLPDEDGVDAVAGIEAIVKERGTLAGYPRDHPVDINGRPLPGARLQYDDVKDAPKPWPNEAGAETLPTDSEARKGIPIVTGLFDYFPAALAEVAKVSKAGNDKHNPGEPMHWARSKSMDQADCIGRHLMERGGFDPETGQRHTAQLAWRALALLQLELEADGAPVARGARP